MRNLFTILLIFVTFNINAQISAGISLTTRAENGTFAPMKGLSMQILSPRIMGGPVLNYYADGDYNMSLGYLFAVDMHKKDIGAVLGGAVGNEHWEIIGGGVFEYVSIYGVAFQPYDTKNKKDDFGFGIKVLYNIYP